MNAFGWEWNIRRFDKTSGLIDRSFTRFFSSSRCSMFGRKHYVYLIVSFRGLYVGKGSGERVWESLNERKGITYIILGRYFTARNAYRAEGRLIRRLRRLYMPLQNGRAPRRSWWKRLRSNGHSRRKFSMLEGCIAIVLLFFTVCSLMN